MTDIRIIKKYPNRRLYDTELSRYITVADVREFVMKSVDFRVIDATTEEDITRTILLQIILEQEAGGAPLFTTEILTRMIRYYGNSMQNVFTAYLENSMKMFADQQKQMQEQMRGLFPVDTVSAMTAMMQKNMDLWRDLQDTFLKSTLSAGRSEKDKT